GGPRWSQMNRPASRASQARVAAVPVKPQNDRVNATLSRPSLLQRCRRELARRVRSARPLLVGLALLGTGAASGCAHNESYETSTPTAQGAVVRDTYIYDYGQPVGQPPPPPAPPAGDVSVTATATVAPQPLGYDVLSTGDQVEVVRYVHTYEQSIESYPRVYWSGRWYYNVNGDFVFWSPAFGAWVTYWGPPTPLVHHWNAAYPRVRYSWAVGYYGPGWYWGGIGLYGFHAYGVPVTHHHHH